MRTCFVIFLSVFLLFNYSHAANFKPIEPHPDYNHTKYAPQCNPDDITKQFRAYTTCFDGDDDDNGDGIADKWAIPQWVSYEMKKFPGQLPKGPKRPSKWITVKELFEKCIAPADDSYHFPKTFRDANPDSPQLGYDRGHMCMKQHAWRLGQNADWNTHTVLNACPQKHELNAGIWLNLEDKTAEWADKYGMVWIIDGPIVFNKTPTKWLGESGEVPVAIPDAFYKIVIRESNGEIFVLAFIFPHVGIGYNCGNNCDLTPYLTSVDIIEALTGLDFNIDERAEGVIQVKVWE